MTTRQRLGLLTAVALLPGCYHYYFATQTHDPGNTTTFQSTRVIALWGAVDDRTPMPPGANLQEFCAEHPEAFQCMDCRGGGLVDVHVQRNLGFTFLSVITLGFLDFVRITYRCAPDTGEEGFSAVQGTAGGSG
ncbi:MAG: hypothetical protein ACFCGT_25825 [Sandaracinaceae bacterium]